MKFTCEKYQLQNACTIVSRAVASKSPISSLEGILIEATADGLKLTGYDLKKGIFTKIDADVMESGSIVIGAKLFVEIIRKFPEGTISFAAKDDDLSVKIKCGKSEYNFVGISPEDYPEMPVIDEENTISIPQGILKSMINQTIFAIATNDIRPVYTGSLFEAEGDTLTVVSVDGYRLAKRSELLENAALSKCSFVVPGSSLQDVEKICSDTDDMIHISVGNRHISFTIGDTVLISRRLEGEFLNYKRSIPEDFKYVITVDRSDFIQTIDRVSLIVSDKNTSPVRMTFGEGSIDCLCLTAMGKAQDVCYCEGSGDGLEIGFNDRYMMDALKAAGSEKVQVCLKTASSPCVIKAADGSNKYTYMILPVRLKAGA